MSQPVNFHPRITRCFQFKLKCRTCFRHTFCYGILWKKWKFPIQYPPAHRIECIIDNYHGTNVADPYRWLENPNSDEVRTFIQRQNKLTQRFLSTCDERKYIEKRLSDLFDYPKYSCPFKRGKHYFFFKSTGLQPETILYHQDVLEGPSTVFLDLNIKSDGGTLSVYDYSFSESGDVVAYALSYCGSDWLRIQFKDATTAKTYPDVLDRSKFTNLSWSHDGLGIFYSCYEKNNNSIRADGTEIASSLNQRVCYHRLGTAQSDDIVVAQFPHKPHWNIRAVVSHCGRYLLLFPWATTSSNCLYFTCVEKGMLETNSNFQIIPIIPDLGIFFYEYVTSIENVVYLKTNHGAPNGRLVRIDLHNPSESNWEIFIVEQDPLEWIVRVGNDKLVACYIRNVRHGLTIFDLATGSALQSFELEIGTITCRSGRWDDNVFFFRHESPFIPMRIYRINLDEKPWEMKVFREIKLPCFNPEGFMVKQVTFRSKDGTDIPMFLLHKKLLRFSGENFCRLYGYGGFGSSQLLTFSPNRLFILTDLDGVDAVPNIRGGGEFGEKWHADGSKEKKQNSFDDFQAAAEFLIRMKYTKASKLAVHGASNGGLLVGACINQRPDLFGAAVAAVGLMDLLRFHKFTVGYFWASEYGTADSEEEFAYLYRISPLHNIRAPSDPNTQYPATLVLTADHDNRVVPLHSLKYIAELQYTIGKGLPQQTNPLLLRVGSKSGHGAGKTCGTIVQEYADIFSFLKQALGLHLQTWRGPDAILSSKDTRQSKQHKSVVTVQTIFDDK